MDWWIGDGGSESKSLSRGFYVSKDCCPLGGHPISLILAHTDRVSQAPNDPFDSIRGPQYLALSSFIVNGRYPTRAVVTHVYPPPPRIRDS